jgi:predicted phosphodiesterase
MYYTRPMPPRVFADVALASTLLASAAPAVALAAGDLQKGPYLQHLASTSVDIRVEVASPAPVTVDVSADRTDAETFTQTVASAVATFHSLHVTGLSPATRYRYSVHVAGGAGSHDGSFVTAPDGSSHASFSFVAYGDNRTDGPAHERVVRAIARESCDFLVHTGDFVIRGDDEDAWQSFFDIEQPLLREHSLFACVGNHELFQDREAAHFERYFGPSVPVVVHGVAPPIYGTFRWGRARFFLLNAFVDWDKGPERAWLDDALVRTDHEEGIDLRIAVIHHSPYSAGPHGNNLPLLAARIDDLLIAHHVDLVLAGHDHIYERGETKGLKYVITGGGGAPLYRDITAIPSTRKVESTYNYVLATVTDDAVRIVSKRPDGSLLEACGFERGGPWTCDGQAKQARPVPDAEMPTGGIPEKEPGKGHCGCSVPGTGRGGGSAATLGLLLAAALVRRTRAVDGIRP